MRIAMTFRDQPEHERRDNEYDYSSLSRREAKHSGEQRELVTAVRKFLLHLVLLLPRPNQNRTIVFPDIGIVEARF